jgi:hypothetical protein
MRCGLWDVAAAVRLLFAPQRTAGITLYASSPSLTTNTYATLKATETGMTLVFILRNVAAT